jgi:spermidine/putrescine transport system permease protein
MGRRVLSGYACLVYLFLYAPIAVVVVFAFNDSERVLFWGGFSTKWFGSALRNEDIQDALKNTVLIALLNAVIACALGTALALAASRMRAWVRVPLDTVAYMTLVTPEIVFGIAALIFLAEAGSVLGLEDGSLLGFWAIVVCHVVFNASVVALVVRARFVSMGQTLEEASYDLHAGPWATFRQITLPRLAPAILAGGLLAFSFSFDDFITSNFVSDPDTQTLPLFIFAQLRFGVSPEINAVATMMLAVALAAIVVAYLVLRRTEQPSTAASPASTV